MDISVDGDFDDANALKDRVEVRLTDSFVEKGLIIIDFKFREEPAMLSDDLKTFWGGYQCEFKLIDRDKYESNVDDVGQIRRLATPLNTSGSTKFKIDWTFAFWRFKIDLD